MSILLSGCFTGIESTKKITLSREDKLTAAPTREETLLTSIRPAPHSEWSVGKIFYVAEERASVMLDLLRNPSGHNGLQAGDTLAFERAGELRTPDGKKHTALYFRHGEDEYRFVGGETEAEGGYVTSDALPGLIDPLVLRAIADSLSGKRLWTLSASWMDEEGNRQQGLKFDPVEVVDVSPGTMIFPVRIAFRDLSGRKGIFLMNYGYTGKESRGFSSLFSLEDPRIKYQGITDSIWENIKHERVTPGMTKHECRIAKGNPTDVYEGHDYSKSMLIWVYPDATTLYFEDDLLVRVDGY